MKKKSRRCKKLNGERKTKIKALVQRSQSIFSASLHSLFSASWRSLHDHFAIALHRFNFRLPAFLKIDHKRLFFALISSERFFNNKKNQFVRLENVEERKKLVYEAATVGYNNYRREKR